MGRYIKPILLQSAAVLGLAMLATGCASTATGVSQSRLNSVSSQQTLTAEAPRGTVLAVVRYPAFIETDAQDEFYETYGRKAIGGSISSYDAASPEVRAIADSMILKSNYFALSLFKELAERMPEHSVLLSPHAIKLDANGKLTSEPMTQAESLANVVSVDFAAYSFPDVKKMMQSEPLTFGDIITPLVTVRTDHRASATTQGVLLASRPLLRGAVANGRKTTAAGLVGIQDGRLDGNIPELDFITFLNGAAPVRVVSQPLTSRRADNTLSTLPIEKIRLDSDKIRNIDSRQAGVVDPLEDKYTAGLANQIVKLVNETDINKASMVRRAGAISQFDDSLAALTLIGSGDAGYQSRARYAERLLEAEQKYLSVQSLRLFDGVHNGEMGAQVRDMLKAEYDILEKRRSLARQQNISTGLAAIAVVAAGAALSQAGEGLSTIGQQIAVNALLQGAIFAGSQSFSYKRRSDAVGSNYLNSIAPSLDEQTSVQLDLIDSNETITAIRFEDLRSKLQVLYDEKQRSLDTIATRCGYTHTGTSVNSGSWMGVCENGLANGTGVGVLRNSDGSAVEYYGYAENGRPQGAGYMIVHGLTGSHALEGQFEDGLADGVVRVSKPGANDVNRLYRAGEDVGAAPKGQGVISPFDTPIDTISPIAFAPSARAEVIRIAALAQ